MAYSTQTPTIYTVDEWAQQSMKVLPKGQAWDNMTTVGSNLYEVVSTLSNTSADLQNEAANFIPAQYPASASYMLTDWETSLGLPGPCQGTAPTVAQRRSQVVARFSGLGGSSIQWLYQFAYNLGFLITITELTAENNGSVVPWIGVGTDFTFTVNCASTTLQYAVANAAMANDTLWDDIAGDVLECELNTVKPVICLIYYNFYTALSYSFNTPSVLSYSAASGGNITISGTYSGTAATWLALSTSNTTVPISGFYECTSTNSGADWSISYPVPTAAGTYYAWVIDANNENSTISPFAITVK